jgi:hypothetical protein
MPAIVVDGLDQGGLVLIGLKIEIHVVLHYALGQVASRPGLVHRDTLESWFTFFNTTDGNVGAAF